MLQMLSQNRLSALMGQIQPIKQMLASAKNPQAMMQQILSQNPNYQQISKLIQDNGGDAQKAFYALANQMGVDPNEILNALK